MDRILNLLIDNLKFEKKYYRNELNVKENFVCNSFEVLKKELNECSECELHLSVKNKVLGLGDKEADLMLIGEAPGENEDLKGMPFVGRAGEKLTKMLDYIGLSRDEVYITNIVKCRPPKNADPVNEWITKCRRFLDMEIELVKPKYILTLGRFAARVLLKMDLKMNEFSGNFYKMENGIIIVPTYHPSALLLQKGERLQHIREHVANDLKLLKKIMNGENNG